jgi:uncharacterized protein
MLKLADNLKLPLDVVTQTIAILAKRRAGKSYTMRRLTEQLVKASQQVVLVDPKGDQWGIRSAADGKGPGLPLVILGGERADVPLEASSGEMVAKLVVEERVSAVLDLSLFRKHEVSTFMTGFLENLYRLKAREIYRTPMMLVIDEADAVAPQKPQKGEERMLGAAEDIVRRGGQRGIGCVLVSQRSAVLNKNVLTQAQVLVALRTIAPQDLAAMSAWIDVHGTAEQRATLMESLPSLPIGDAWFWSPGWPTTKGIFQRVHVLPIETFDSGATPAPGEKRREPKTVADVDLEALKRQMAATIEKAKADDPRELRKKIVELEKQLKSKIVPAPAAAAKPTKGDTERAGKIAELKGDLTKHRRALEEAVKILVKVKAVDFAIDSDEQRKALEQAVAGAIRQVTGPIEKRVTALTERVEGIRQQAGAAEKAIKQLLDEPIDLTVQVERREPFSVAADRPVRSAQSARRSVSGVSPVSGVSIDTNGRLPEGERVILIAAAQYPDGLTREQASILTGYKRSTRDAYIQRLQGKGYLQPGGGTIVATDAGVAALGSDYEPLPTGVELQRYWLDRLPAGEKAILEVAIYHHPKAVGREEIDAATGFKRSTRDAYIQRLQARQLLAKGGGAVTASSVLFE